MKEKIIIIIVGKTVILEILIITLVGKTVILEILAMTLVDKTIILEILALTIVEITLIIEIDTHPTQDIDLTLIDSDQILIVQGILDTIDLDLDLTIILGLEMDILHTQTDLTQDKDRQTIIGHLQVIEIPLDGQIHKIINLDPRLDSLDQGIIIINLGKGILVLNQTTDNRVVVPKRDLYLDNRTPYHNCLSIGNGQTQSPQMPSLGDKFQDIRLAGRASTHRLIMTPFE